LAFHYDRAGKLMGRQLRISLLHQLFAFTFAAAAAFPVLAQEIYDDLTSKPSGKIYFNSVTPKSKWELVHRKYDRKPTTIWGTLYMPEKPQGRVPAMVISHGSAGVQGKDIDRWVHAFNQMGIAAFVVDSFGGRGITGTMDDQSQLSPAAIKLAWHRRLVLGQRTELARSAQN